MIFATIRTVPDIMVGNEYYVYIKMYIFFFSAQCVQNIRYAEKYMFDDRYTMCVYSQ